MLFRSSSHLARTIVEQFLPGRLVPEQVGSLSAINRCITVGHRRRELLIDDVFLQSICVLLSFPNCYRSDFAALIWSLTGLNEEFATSFRASAILAPGARGVMSSGSYNSVNKDFEDDEYGQGQGGYSRQNFPSYDSYNDSQQQQQESMTPQPSVGRFTEKEKLPTTMFSRKPATPKTSLQDSSASPSTTGGIVNLRAPPRAEDKMNKRKK